MARSSRLEDIDITREEMDSIGKAMQNQEFRQLLADYIEEINDPENQRLYEQEITQLERERGVEATFVHPEPGYVIKTTVGGEKKAFINICSNDLMKTSKYETARQGNRQGTSWSIPYSVSEPKEDYDKKLKRVWVYDVVFHSSTLKFASKKPEFKKLLNDTACDAVESNFNVQLDRKNLKFPKLNYKGTPKATILRKDIPGATPDPEDVDFYEKIYPSKKNKTSENPPKLSSKQAPCSKLPKPDDTKYTAPKYCIKHRHGIDLQEFTENQNAKLLTTVPSHLVVEIKLPLLKSAGDMNLDITEKTICLISEEPSKYKLNLTLPYPVHEENGHAKFDKDTRQLEITLPVKVENFQAPLCTMQDELTLVNAIDNHVDTGNGNVDDVDNTNKTEIAKIIEIDQNTSSVEDCCLVTDLEEDQDIFFNPKSTYALPDFTTSLAKHTLTFTLDIKNIVTESLCHKNVDDNFYFKCTSIGAGYFSLNYGFFLKLKVAISDVSVELWSDYISIQISVDSVEMPKCFYVGADEINLENLEMPQEQKRENGSEDDISPDDSLDSDDTHDKISSKCNDTEITKLVDGTGDAVVPIVPDGEVLDHGDLVKPSTDQKSESQGILKPVDSDKNISKMYDEEEYANSSDSESVSFETDRKSKGILKPVDNGKNMSEIYDEEEHVSSSDNEFIPDEIASTSFDTVNEQPKYRKTVTFKETVSRKIYRHNSSISGQKSKNKRKKNNKKRALEKRCMKNEHTSDPAQKFMEFARDNEALKGSPITNLTDDEKQPKQYLTFRSELLLNLDLM